MDRIKEWKAPQVQELDVSLTASGLIEALDESKAWTNFGYYFIRGGKS